MIWRRQLQINWNQYLNLKSTTNSNGKLHKGKKYANTDITVKFYSKSKLLFQRLKSKLIPPLYPPITGYLDGFLRKKKKNAMHAKTSSRSSSLANKNTHNTSKALETARKSQFSFIFNISKLEVLNIHRCALEHHPIFTSTEVNLKSPTALRSATRRKSF